MKTFISTLGAAVLGLLPLNAQFLINPYRLSAGGTSYTARDGVSGTTNGSNTIGQDSLNVWAIGVQFTASFSGTITKVEIQASAVNTGGSQLYYCEIRDSAANLPTTLVGSTSAGIAGDSGQFPASEGTVTFYPTATVVSGSTYFVCIRASAENATDYIQWYRISATAQICSYNGSAWTSSSTSRRSKFQLYSTP